MIKWKSDILHLEEDYSRGPDLYINEILHLKVTDLKTKSVSTLLHLLYEDLPQIRYRTDLINSKYYIGVDNYISVHSIKLNEFGFVLWESVVSNCATNMVHHRLTSECGKSGIFKCRTDIFLTFSKFDEKWSYYTSSLNITPQHVLYMEPIDPEHEFFAFDKIISKRFLFENFNDLIKHLIINYTCPSCFYAERVPMPCALNWKYMHSCLTEGTSKYYQTERLEYMCFFFITNLWFHKREIVKAIITPSLYELLCYKYRTHRTPRWPLYNKDLIERWRIEKIKNLCK
jgi:hypothetical protein